MIYRLCPIKVPINFTLVWFDIFVKELTIGKKKRRGSCHARSKLRANASQRQRRKGKKKMNSRRKGVTESENKKSNEVITKLFGAL